MNNELESASIRGAIEQAASPSIRPAAGGQRSSEIESLFEVWFGAQSGLELLQLINDLLELSRIDASMEFLAISETDSQHLIEGIVNMSAKYAERNAIDVVVEEQGSRALNQILDHEF